MRQADALALPFPDQSFDAVACQFGVMFFPDRVQGYREAHRVLKPGGRFSFNAWDRISENEFVFVASQALASVTARSAPFHGTRAARLPRRGPHPVPT